MAYTIFTLSLISLILVFWLYKLIRQCFIKPFHLWKEQKGNTAPSKEATILSVKKLKERKFPLLEVQLIFENFSGYPIQRNIRFWDSKPHLNRYKKDGTVRITLDPNKKPNEPYFLQSGKYRVSLAFILLCSLLTMAYIGGCYFLMGEAISRIRDSSAYYETIFSSSFVGNGTFLFGTFLLIFLYFLFKRMGLLASKKTKSDNWDLLYHGLGAMATVQKYEDTGTLINDNPVVKFSYTYPDQRGQIIAGSDKKIVGKLEIVGLPDIRELEIMYLPQDPHVSRLTENLQNQGFSSYVGGIILFSLLLFSIFFIVGFCQDLF